MSLSQDYFNFSHLNDPYHNLALEEYLIREFELPEHGRLILFYINEPCVVLGKNQNVFREINLKYRLENDVKIARRISGGGTVVHDMGNLNVSIIEPFDIKKVNNYESTVGYFVSIINEMGIRCKMNERNAILLDNGNKVSGSAQFSNSKKILTHFTLLYDADIRFVEEVLKPNKYQVKSKASESHPSKVQNIKEVYQKSFDDFLQNIQDKLQAQPLTICDSIFESIKHDYLPKYQSQEYIFDKASDCMLSFDTGNIEIKKGKIVTVKIEGIDFEKYIGRRLSYQDIGEENELWGVLL